MPVTPPKCKFCPNLHWDRICPTLRPSKIRVMSAAESKAAQAKKGQLLALPAPPAPAKKKAKKKA